MKTPHRISTRSHVISVCSHPQASTRVHPYACIPHQQWGTRSHQRGLDVGGLSDIVNGDDVRVVEGGCRAGLLLEAAQPVLVCGRRLRQHLDCYVPIEPLIVRPVDLAHPADADLLDDAVMAEGATDEVSHCGWFP